MNTNCEDCDQKMREIKRLRAACRQYNEEVKEIISNFFILIDPDTSGHYELEGTPSKALEVLYKYFGAYAINGQFASDILKQFHEKHGFNPED